MRNLWATSRRLEERTRARAAPGAAGTAARQPRLLPAQDRVLGRCSALGAQTPGLPRWQQNGDNCKCPEVKQLLPLPFRYAKAYFRLRTPRLTVVIHGRAVAWEINIPSLF